MKNCVVLSQRVKIRIFDSICHNSDSKQGQLNALALFYSRYWKSSLSYRLRVIYWRSSFILSSHSDDAVLDDTLSSLYSKFKFLLVSPLPFVLAIAAAYYGIKQYLPMMIDLPIKNDKERFVESSSLKSILFE